MVTVRLAATSGAVSAPAGGEGSSAPPPVERVARELRTGAMSVIVFVSVGGKEYVATAGARRPTADQRFRVWSVTKTFTATIVLELVQEGALRLDSTLEDHVPGVIPRGDEVTIRQLLQHRSGLADVTDYASWLERAVRSPSTRPIDSLRFAGSKPLVFAPGTQGGYSKHELHRAGSRDRKGHGALVRAGARAAHHRRRARPHRAAADAAPAGPRRRRLQPEFPWAAGAIVSNAHDLSRFYSALLSGRILSSASLATMTKTVEHVGLGIFSTDLPCGLFWGHAGGILDYQTLVSASEKGDRIAVVSLRSQGFLPPVERALLCAEPAAGSAQASWKISFSSGRGSLYVMNADGSGQRWLTLTAGRISAWSPDGRRIVFESARDGNNEVYVMNADGSRQRRLTRKPRDDYLPTWSPAGGRSPS